MRRAALKLCLGMIVLMVAAAPVAAVSTVNLSPSSQSHAHGSASNWTGTWSGGLTIVVGGSPVEFLPLWSEVTEAGRSINAWGVEEERSVPIFICRHPRQDLPALFLRLGPDWT